jgi:hypothetical protein
MTTSTGARLGRLAVVLLIAGVALAVAFGVSQMAYPTVSAYPDTNEEAGRVEVDDATRTARVILSADAARRIGLRLAPVARAAGAAGPARLTIPAAAVFYDPAGDTWAYVASRPLVFARQRVTVVSIHDGVALLSAGPPAGSQVVTVGAAELYGTEVGVGEE